MRLWKFGLVLGMVCLLGSAAQAQTAKAEGKKRLLVVTHSGGFIHDSVGMAEDVLKQLGAENGFEVTCYRFTADPDAKLPNGKTALEDYAPKFRQRTGKTVEKENCGRINAETLKNFDAVFFFTTGSKRSQPAPLTNDELGDLIGWVRAGGAFIGSHCASDTLYDTPYGELVGGFFRTHPPGTQKVKIRVEDPKHPAAAGFSDGMDYEDEMYIFTDTPYSRDRLHIILSVVKGTFTPKNGNRPDEDYAVSWCQQIDKGRSFYTSLGHRKEVWKDPRFQQHLMGGLKWAVGQANGDATPSSKQK